MQAVAVPSGPIHQWCFVRLGFNMCATSPPFSKGNTDFITICCNGYIVDPNVTLYNTNSTIDLDDLYCCQGDGYLPLSPSSVTSCPSSMPPTPLASLAGTNTDNAQTWTIPNTQNMYLPMTPWCAYLQATPTAVRTVTVPTPSISTTSFPAPATATASQPPQQSAAVTVTNTPAIQTSTGSALSSTLSLSSASLCSSAKSFRIAYFVLLAFTLVLLM
jgi:hypothetical protein